jgi:hypothetical protein
MSELIRFPLDDESAVLVESGSVADSERPEIGPVSRTGDLVRSATTTFDDALTHVRKAAAIALAKFKDMEVGPDTVEVEFGVKLNAEAGAVIARTGGEGHIKVKLTWGAPHAAEEDDPEPA